MIYVDTSVALAHLFAEDRRPPASFWTETLVSSRLLEYEWRTPPAPSASRCGICPDGQTRMEPGGGAGWANPQRILAEIKGILEGEEDGEFDAWAT